MPDQGATVASAPAPAKTEWAAPGLRVAEESGLGVAVFRGHRGAAAAAAARVGLACGCEAPLAANTTAVHGRLRLSWIEPAAWMLTGPAAEVRGR